MKYLLLLLFPLTVFGQSTETRHVLENKDTLVNGKKWVKKTKSISYYDTSTYSYVIPYIPKDTTTIPEPPIFIDKIEGFGALTTGGAGKPIYRVTNLNGSGTGSLEAALGSNRTIIFDVAGTIIERLQVYNMTNLTIDGLSAPSPGITINNNGNGDGISVENSTNVIVQGLRVTNAGMDGINVVASKNVIVQYCTSWNNGDGNIDIASDAQFVTAQYNILGGGKDGWGGAMLITARNVSVHHNLFVSNTSQGKAERMPLAHSNYTPVGSPNVDFRNNLVYDWDGYGSSICYNSTGNVVNNYYFSNTSPNKALNKNDGYSSGDNGKIFSKGNISGNTGVTFISNTSEYQIPSQYKVTTQLACDAAKLVLQKAGTRYPDATEQGFKKIVTLNCQ